MAAWSGSWGALLLIVFGVWVLFQTFGGGLVDRLAGLATAAGSSPPQPPANQDIPPGGSLPFGANRLPGTGGMPAAGSPTQTPPPGQDIPPGGSLPFGANQLPGAGTMAPAALGPILAPLGA